jgi:hypothetical protein
VKGLRRELEKAVRRILDDHQIVGCAPSSELGGERAGLVEQRISIADEDQSRGEGTAVPLGVQSRIVPQIPVVVRP